MQSEGRTAGCELLAQRLRTQATLDAQPRLAMQQPDAGQRRTKLLTKLPCPWPLNASTTISPRRWRSLGFASAFSAAEEEASGYSPPTPTA